MNERKVRHPHERSLIALGLLFLIISGVEVNVTPDAGMLPDLALILTLYCALRYDGEAGLILPLFAGAYVGSFSSFPVEYIGLYGMIYYAARFISSFFQLRFMGYPMLLAFVFEFLIGSIHALEIFLKQPLAFSFHVVTHIIFIQSFLTTVFLYPIFLIFDRFSRSSSLHVKHVLR